MPSNPNDAPPTDFERKAREVAFCTGCNQSVRLVNGVCPNCPGPLGFGKHHRAPPIDLECDRCGKPESAHNGMQKFCPFYSTFRAATPAPVAPASVSGIDVGEAVKLLTKYADAREQAPGNFRNRWQGAAEAKIFRIIADALPSLVADAERLDFALQESGFYGWVKSTRHDGLAMFTGTAIRTREEMDRAIDAARTSPNLAKP